MGDRLSNHEIETGRAFIERIRRQAGLPNDKPQGLEVEAAPVERVCGECPNIIPAGEPAVVAARDDTGQAFAWRHEQCPT